VTTPQGKPATGQDAVLVVPGIMGSELIEAGSGRTLWGAADLGWYVRAWTTGTSLRELRVTDAERDGHAGRIKPGRLLQFPAFAPVLRGFEPYTALTARLRQVSEPGAVRDFPYDWRLSIEHNARLLVKVADEHLTSWRRQTGREDVLLTIVAHSMGGLVSRYFTEVLGGDSIVRAVVTLGTPFYGAAKAAHLLSTGEGTPFPLPKGRLRKLVGTLPGLHDLLPSYRCVDDGTSYRRLTPSDVAALDGDAELAEESFARRQLLLVETSTAKWWPMVGVQQETIQSLVLADGVAHPRYYTCEPAGDGTLARIDRLGDGTVYREAAALTNTNPLYVPQTHGALASRAEGITHAAAVVTKRDKGPWLADETPIGLQIPDIVRPGEPFDLRITGSADPASIACMVTDAGTNQPAVRPFPVPRDGALVAAVTLPHEGVFRVEAKIGGLSPVSELIMASSGEVAE
jgi:pimeloyl-ACP methyl ester carboxylesterase